jgi:diacylglycerol diphosphate phosphatase / phosphatidate phosphatase
MKRQLMGHGYALSSGTFIQSILKFTIGGFRPHFLFVCKPKPHSKGHGFEGMYFDSSVCTGDQHQIRNALMGFPSGHTVAAFAGFVFLALWLNAKLKIFANRQTRLWHMLVFWMPVTLAMWLGASKSLDGHHFHKDVVFGAVLGTLTAFCAYRARYGAVFNWRYNHVPLSNVEEWPVDHDVVEKRFTTLKSHGWAGKETLFL